MLESRLIEGITELDERFKRASDLSPLVGAWLVPDKVELRDQDLVYSGASREPVEPDRKAIREGVLGGFIRLTNATNKEVLEYARRWGVLGLCRDHGLPATHQMKTASADMITADPLIYLFNCEQRNADGWIYEPLDRWKYFSEQVRTLITLALALHKGKLGEKEHWDIVLGGPWGKPGYVRTMSSNTGEILHFEPSLVESKIRLSFVVNRWLAMTAVRPFFFWAEEYPDLELSPPFNLPKGHNLLSVLAVQAMLLINRSTDYSICAGCDKPFFLRRGQSSNRRSFCRECGLKAARREAVRRYYREERTNPSRVKRKALTETQVQAIKRALRRPKRGLVKQLAEKYGISIWTIYKIRERKTWDKLE